MTKSSRLTAKTGNNSRMVLNAFAAVKKRSLLESLQAGLPPHEGSFSPQVWASVKGMGTPQIGSTTYKPEVLILEFVYRDALGNAMIFPVTIPAPERIMFLPVPSWVVESIWQGDIDGSYHFESDAHLLVQEFQALLPIEVNKHLFEKQMAKRRE